MSQLPTGGSTRSDHPDVVVHPPILILIVIVAAVALDWMWPWSFASYAGSGTTRGLGIVLFAAAAGLAGWAVVTFVRGGTNVPTYRPAVALIETGPYRLTRNPIYIGLILALAGIALLIDYVWLLLGVLPFALVLHYGVVRREEAYLQRLFGQPYADYCRRVPRWIGF